MLSPTTSTQDLRTVRSITNLTSCSPSLLTSQWLYRDAARRVLYLNPDTAVSGPPRAPLLFAFP